MIFSDIDFLPSIELKQHYIQYRDVIKDISGVLNQNTEDYFGEVIGIIPSAFKRINGFPNNVSVLGYENQCLKERILEYKFPIITANKGTFENKDNIRFSPFEVPKNMKNMCNTTEMKNNGLLNISYSIGDIKDFGNMFIYNIN